MRAAVTFIIPATAAGTGRERALRSLLAQSDPDWLALVIGAGVAPWLPLEARYYSVKGPTGAEEVGLVNAALAWLHLAASLGQVNTEWVAVLGEQDTVSENFVARLRDVQDGGDSVDIIAFRTKTSTNAVLPHPFYPAIVPGEIGSAVVFRRALLERTRIELHPVGDGMSYLVRQALDHGARLLLHPDISYFEKDSRP